MHTQTTIHIVIHNYLHNKPLMLGSALSSTQPTNQFHNLFDKL